MNLSSAQTFPRLLYLSDVPIEASFHGSALLYRLLEEYPTDKLLIVEPTASCSSPSRRLQNVKYLPFWIGWPRLLHTRFAHIYGSFIVRRAPTLHRKISRLTRDFQPEAVLSVTQGYSWLTAAAFAERSRLPLHLILHDDWLVSLAKSPCVKNWAEKTFGQCYRAAVSRLCVSSSMEESYSKRYGVGGTVLYPSRAKDCDVVSAPVLRSREKGTGLVFAYAGTVNYKGYGDLLRMLAETLEKSESQLVIFGPVTESKAAAFGLRRSNITLGGQLPSAQLIERLKNEADVMFLPMSFAPRDRQNMEISFPSKLTDYTLTGLPLLIVGPNYCSAVRWAKENPGVAEVVETVESALLQAAVDRLVENVAYRQQLAACALKVGRTYFSHETAQATFLSALSSSHAYK
jgi:glycosyltransferase involved in cell wall biosynthesis